MNSQECLVYIESLISKNRKFGETGNQTLCRLIADLKADAESLFKISKEKGLDASSKDFVGELNTYKVHQELMEKMKVNTDLD